MSSSAPPPEYPQFPGGGQNPYGQHTPGHAALVPTYLWQSIAVTLLCCLPFGLVGIYFSTKVSSHQALGNLQAAQEASRKAKGWSIASLVAGLVVVFGYFALLAIGLMAADVSSATSASV